MSCLSLGKKLRPAKKAWKGFTSTIQRKLNKLKQSKAIKKTKIHLSRTLTTISNRFPSFLSRFLPHKIKKPVMAQSTLPPYKNYSHKQKFAAVYVDHLFTAEPISVQAKKLEAHTAATTMEMKPFRKTTLAETSKAGSDRGAASGVVHVPPKGGSRQSVVELKEVPQFQGVDERAEEFIARFKEEMKLQRKTSLEEYQEMLARGV